MRIYVIIKTAWSSGLCQPGPLGRLGEGSYATDFRCNLRKQDDMV